MKKTCRSCNREIPVEGFYVGGSGKPRPDCKECQKEQQRKKNDQLKLRTPEEAIKKTTKRCNDCGVTLPVGEFGIALVNPDGLKPVCKACEAKRSMKWVTAVPERQIKANENSRQWRINNPEKFREKTERWRHENPDKYRTIMEKAYAKYRESEKGREKISAQRARRTESGMGAAYKRQRDAAKLQATPAWFSLDSVRPIYEEAALLTEMTGEKWEVDHIDPLQNRLVCGLHVAENLQSITQKENRQKKNKFTPYRIDGTGRKYALKGLAWVLVESGSN